MESGNSIRVTPRRLLACRLNVLRLGFIRCGGRRGDGGPGFEEGASLHSLTVALVSSNSSKTIAGTSMSPTRTGDEKSTMRVSRSNTDTL